MYVPFYTCRFTKYEKLKIKSTTSNISIYRSSMYMCKNNLIQVGINNLLKLIATLFAKVGLRGGFCSQIFTIITIPCITEVTTNPKLIG